MRWNLANRIVTLVGLCLTVAHPATADGARDAVLDALLLRLDRTAATYAARSRSFTCKETIRWARGGESRRLRYGYVVTLDDGGTLRDYRTRLRWRKKKGPVRIEPLDEGVPAYLRSAYLWVFIFKRDRWPHHRYEIVDEGVVLDRPAIAIRFEPIPPYDEGTNNWFGTAWVDRESAQLLKVAAHRPEDQDELERIARHEAGEAVSDWVYLVETITTYFSVVEQGMRFPGRVELQQVNHDFLRGLDAWRSRQRTTLRVHQTYSDYRFFEVDAKVAIDSLEPIEP